LTDEDPFNIYNIYFDICLQVIVFLANKQSTFGNLWLWFRMLW